DAEVLVATVREALSGGSVGRRWQRRIAVAGVATAIGLLLVGWIGLNWVETLVWPPWAETREAGNATALAEAGGKRKNEEAARQRLATLSAAAAEEEAKRKSEEVEQQRLATLKAEQERQARAAAEAEAKRKSEEADQQRVAALTAEEQKRNAAEAEARARYAALMSRGTANSNAG